jgi:cytosine/adenosine deaminase-related metal-dependent hydrolase
VIDAAAVRTTLLRAAWVAPMTGPPVRDGAVAFRSGRIVEVGTAHDLLRRHASAELIDRPAAIVLPGLINAHTHLELSEITRRPLEGDFVDWLLQLIPRGQITLADVHASVARSIPIGIRQCLRFGVTCVGDISRHATISRPLLSASPLRVVSYGEIQAMAQRREFLEPRLNAAIDRSFQSDSFTPAVSPHAPYSVEISAYQRCLQAAQAMNMPLATHLAESPDETPFLADHSGHFRELWNQIGGWDDHVPTFPAGPIRMAQSIGLLDYPKTLLAHVNYCDDAELNTLSSCNASVVYCPRTHAYFGHPTHRWRQMLALGINVAVGTDSCASSPDLNLVDELRLLRHLAPDVPALDLWRLATTHAAQAIGRPDVGSLRPGTWADLALFDAPIAQSDPLEALLDSQQLPAEIWIGGTVVSAESPISAGIAPSPSGRALG